MTRGTRMANGDRVAPIDPGDPSLPVAGAGRLAGVRKSRRGRWRAVVLTAVHVLFAVHATHFLISGRTLSPVEPSESMYTLEQGYVNAGFVFFAVALLSTLVFGRFFCGWGCHIVALQDLCGWIMKRLGVRPRPFRSRLLGLVPLGLALYMFVWPSAKRVAAPWVRALAPEPMARFTEWLLEGTPERFPGFSNHLVTSGFWDTFPGPWFAVLTLLTCGFAVVYFLGAKGFCSYGCPYGGFFGPVEQLSPGRIRVTDACDQCGHCTATCTSNVLVHDEVRRFGMVVDPGCMKCTDCISVCPKEALFFGFGRPAIFRRRDAPPRRSSLWGASLGREIFVIGVFLLAAPAYRGLYDGPPLLMSVGLAGITAFAALKLWQLVGSRTVRLQNLTLKLDGSWRGAGRLFAGLALAWFVFTAHSGFVQWHRFRGRQLLERTEATRAEVLSGVSARRSYSERHRQAAGGSFAHFATADRWGLVDVVEVKLGLAWGHLLEGNEAAGEDALRQAIALAPGRSRLHQDLLELLVARGRFDDAVLALRAKTGHGPAEAADFFSLGTLLVQVQRYDEALEAFRECLRLAPDSAEARYNLGGLLRRLGRPGEAIEQLSLAREASPDDPETHVELGLALMASGRETEALDALRRAVELAPQSAEARLHLRSLIEELERRGAPEQPGGG